MNVEFKIKLGEVCNKNFLVFISTELTKKLKYELISTNSLVWEFKRNNSVLNISHGLNITKILLPMQPNNHSNILFIQI